ncbi:MAG: hypothetical protein JST70_17165 [Bacteroidetes bacterium]|nr:hypothetical protein [Bacteroidota bacterium]
MSHYFDTLKEDYENAEISCLVLHNRKTDEWCNLLTIIELIPAEQQASPIIGTAASNYCDRESIDSNYTVYIARRIVCPIPEAIGFFQSPEKGILLQHDSTLNCLVTLFNESHLEAEPSSDYPLLVNWDTNDTISKILPKRHTSFRVWMKIDRRKKWLSGLTEKQIGKLLAKAGLLSQKHLGFNFSNRQEHMGNLYLCGCNPYLRGFNKTLLDLNKDMVIRFRERVGRSIIGKKIVLEDNRAGNISFSIEQTIGKRLERIEMPHFPDQLCTKIYDHRGHLIENHTGTWVNMNIQMNVQTAELHLTVKQGANSKKVKVPKYSSERPINIGTYDHSLARFLKEKQQDRQLAELERNGQFIFFPGGDEDRERARQAIQELLNKASKVCMLLDPYFGAPDLYYAYIIQNTSIPIQILSSAAFLKSKTEMQSGRKMKQGFLFKRALQKYKRTFPHQSIQVKVLLGGKSPLHDRYIVIDDKVYLLGSSLNEFGSRATTLIKIPHPQPMIGQALAWWNDSIKTKDLSTYLESLKPGK